MKVKVVGAMLVLVGALTLLAGPSDAQTNQTKKKTVVYNSDRTVQISRDEDGRTRTRIIIQKRSFLDPGTETFPDRGPCRARTIPGSDTETKTQPKAAFGV